MLTVMLVTLLVLLALFAIPIDFIYRISWNGRFDGAMHVRWLFGLVHIRIPVESKHALPSAEETHGKDRQRHKSRSKRKTSPLVAWRIKSFRRRIIKLVRDLWRAIHKRDMRLHLLIGLDDPADTGQLWVIMGPLSAVCAQSQAVRIDIEPDFTQSHLALNSSGDIRIIPLQLITIVLGLLLSPPFWYGLQQMQTAR